MEVLDFLVTVFPYPADSIAVPVVPIVEEPRPVELRLVEPGFVVVCAFVFWLPLPVDEALLPQAASASRQRKSRAAIAALPAIDLC
ncbi:MAG: hypothetical protein ACR2GU_11770 [Rubrobacteraceae bacterium]